MSRNLISEPMLNAVTLADELTNYTPWFDVHDMGRWSILFGAVKSASAGNITVTVEGSPDSATGLNDGNPSAASVLVTPLSVLNVQTVATTLTISATSNNVLSKIPSDALRSIRVKYDAAATCDVTNKWVLSFWLIGAAG